MISEKRNAGFPALRFSDKESANMYMRVTQRQIYGNVVGRMGTALSELMESNLQASSQKRINRPSDDAVGMTRVLDYRTSLESIAQYQRNVDTATGWLNLADNTLLTVSTNLTRCLELAEQAANGPLNADNREQISYELRQIYEQMIQLANTKYGDSYIFAGHKNDEPPFEQALTGMSTDDAFADVGYVVQGGASSTIVVQFLESGEIGGAAPLAFRYSSDGGDTWTDGSLDAGSTTLQLGGVSMDLNIPEGTTVMATAVDPDNKNSNDNGTWLYVRPTALYKGDDQDAVHTVAYGAPSGPTATYEGVGYFTSDVTVRIDSVEPPTGDRIITYSYSLDGGRNWVEGNTNPLETAGNTRLPVPGGFLELSSYAARAVGAQYVIKPQRANVDVEISKGETITINNVGKDVFGGMYQGPGDSAPSAVFDGDNRNLFEVLGRLIAYTETNSQDGAAQCVEDLREVDKFIQTKNANIGGRENRLSISSYMLQTMEDTETQALSSIEDVDLFELTTRMAQQQITLQSVLKSSSMMMQLSLLNFI